MDFGLFCQNLWFWPPGGGLWTPSGGPPEGVQGPPSGGSRGDPPEGGPDPKNSHFWGPPETRRAESAVLTALYGSAFGPEPSKNARIEVIFEHPLRLKSQQGCIRMPLERHSRSPNLNSALPKGQNCHFGALRSHFGAPKRARWPQGARPQNQWILG